MDDALQARLPAITTARSSSSRAETRLRHVGLPRCGTAIIEAGTAALLRSLRIVVHSGTARAPCGVECYGPKLMWVAGAHCPGRWATVNARRAQRRGCCSGGRARRLQTGPARSLETGRAADGAAAAHMSPVARHRRICFVCCGGGFQPAHPTAAAAAEFVSVDGGVRHGESASSRAVSCCHPCGILGQKGIFNTHVGLDTTEPPFLVRTLSIAACSL